MMPLADAVTDHGWAELLLKHVSTVTMVAITAAISGQVAITPPRTAYPTALMMCTTTGTGEAVMRGFAGSEADERMAQYGRQQQPQPTSAASLDCRLSIGRN